MSFKPQIHFLHIHQGESSKGSLAQDPNFLAFCKEGSIKLLDNNIKESRKTIEGYKPTIILIDEDCFEATAIQSFQSNKYLPFVVVLIKSQNPDEVHKKTLEYIKAGADETLDSLSSSQEIFLKCFSYLRRKSIFELNQLTNLPGINRSYAIIEHCRQNLSDWVMLHIDTVNIKSFNQMYGLEAGDKAIGQIAKILTESAKEAEESFVGHLGRDNFICILDSNSLETVVAKIFSLFPQILQKLYRQVDYDKGYIIYPASNKVRRREGLLDLSIGHCNHFDRNFVSGSDIVEQAIKNKKIRSSENKKILVLEEDCDFGTLLVETFMREGFEAFLSGGLDEVLDEVENIKPKILLLEASSPGKEGFKELCESLEQYKKDFGLKVIVATNIPGYESFLSAGADVYIPKPYELEVIFREVRRIRFQA